MGYTITEKILLNHIDADKISPGSFIKAKVDLTLGNDITAPIAIKEFEAAGFGQVFDNKKIALVPDHFVPAKDASSSNQAKTLSIFAKKYNIKHFFELGCMGIEHALLPELGLVSTGDLVIGADSHTCTYGAVGAFSTGVGSTDLACSWASGWVWLKVPETIKFIYKGRLNRWLSGKDLILYTIGNIGVDGALYKTMEFSGEVIRRLPMDDRFSMCNMAIEAGAKSGIIEPDDITFRYLREVRANIKIKQLFSDKDAKYVQVKEYDVSTLEPQVACPHLPSNTKPVSSLKDVNLDQVVIGSCTNGRISDLRVAAEILKGKKVSSRVRVIVFPATQKIYLQAIKEGLIEIFINAGASVSTPTCGPCLGGHSGILTKGEAVLATTNRNFIGRMGSPESFVYLSSPAVAASSAILGRIAHPNEVCK